MTSESIAYDKELRIALTSTVCSRFGSPSDNWLLTDLEKILNIKKFSSSIEIIVDAKVYISLENMLTNKSNEEKFSPCVRSFINII